MTNPENPYRAPESDTTAGVIRSGDLDRNAFIMWAIVFGLNMVLPLLFSVELTQHHGRFGMCAASLVLFIAGWVLCALSARTARKLILGAAIVALTQLFPILHVVAGSVSIRIAESFQLADGGGGDPDLDEGGFPEITSELGGFMVTILVGGILLTFASIIGLVLSFVFPQRSLKPDVNASELPFSH